jgi:hypothetical protein
MGTMIYIDIIVLIYLFFFHLTSMLDILHTTIKLKLPNFDLRVILCERLVLCFEDARFIFFSLYLISKVD